MPPPADRGVAFCLPEPPKWLPKQCIMCLLKVIKILKTFLTRHLPVVIGIYWQVSTHLFRQLTALSKFLQMSTSFSATLIPPPVRGWRMLRASPRTNTPDVATVLAGRKLLGILRIRSLLRASRKGSRRCSETEDSHYRKGCIRGPVSI